MAASILGRAARERPLLPTAAGHLRGAPFGFWAPRGSVGRGGKFNWAARAGRTKGTAGGRPAGIV